MIASPHAHIRMYLCAHTFTPPPPTTLLHTQAIEFLYSLAEWVFVFVCLFFQYSEWSPCSPCFSQALMKRSTLSCAHSPGVKWEQLMICTVGISIEEGRGCQGSDPLIQHCSCSVSTHQRRLHVFIQIHARMFTELPNDKYCSKTGNKWSFHSGERPRKC